MREPALFLSEGDLIESGLGDFDFVASVLRDVFKEHALKHLVQPPSTLLQQAPGLPPHDRIISMPAYLGGDFGVLGVKWIGSNASNRDRGLPRASAVLILNDSQTKLPLAFLDCSLINVVRTAVVQVLAMEYLGPKSPKSMGLVGCGRIGGMTLLAAHHRFPSIKTFKVYDNSALVVPRFVSHFAKWDVTCQPLTSFNEVLSTSDVGCVATTNSASYIGPECFPEGSLFLNVSLLDPTADFILKADKIVVDDWNLSNQDGRPLNRMFEAGRITLDSIHAELGQVILGRKKGRDTEQERIFWNPMGMAIEDLGVGYRLYQRARSKGLGKELVDSGTTWDAVF